MKSLLSKERRIIPHKMLITECNSNTIEILFNIEGQKGCSMAIFNPRTIKFQIECEFFIVDVISKFMNSLLKRRHILDFFFSKLKYYVVRYLGCSQNQNSFQCILIRFKCVCTHRIAFKDCSTYTVFVHF